MSDLQMNYSLLTELCAIGRFSFHTLINLSSIYRFAMATIAAQVKLTQPCIIAFDVLPRLVYVTHQFFTFPTFDHPKRDDLARKQ